MPVPASRWKLVFIPCLALLIASAGWGYYRWRYPYGYSHCCDICLGMALNQYAREHGGEYPAGEATPEASLSLLYPEYTLADILRGKTVPLDVVQGVLDRGERLGPDTCGWHYVEGLNLKDDHRIALIWDKAGLGHSGERLSDGGHIVLFVGGLREYVPGSRWPAFLEEQDRLLAQRKQGGR